MHRLVRLAPASCTVLCTPPTGSPVQVTSPAYEAEQRRCDAPKTSDGGPERLRRRGDRRSRRVAHRFIGRGERAGGDPDSANATHVRAVDGVRRRYAGADRVIATAAVYGDGCAIVERSSSATSIFGRRAPNDNVAQTAAAAQQQWLARRVESRRRTWRTESERCVTRCVPLLIFCSTLTLTGT